MTDSLWYSILIAAVPLSLIAALISMYVFAHFAVKQLDRDREDEAKAKREKAEAEAAGEIPAS